MYWDQIQCKMSVNIYQLGTTNSKVKDLNGDLIYIDLNGNLVLAMVK